MERFEALREKILPVLLPWGVKRVALFGSVVRGEDTPESDIDILVELKPPDERPPIGLKWFGLDDTVYLRHILDAIEQIGDYLKGVSAGQFLQERLLQDGVVR